MVWPTLDSVDPSAAAPGQEVVVSGHGGYVRMNGGYDESSRSFNLYFDGTPAGSIGCYVNHCQVPLTIPRDAAPGSHLISVEGGSQIAVQVLSPAPSPTSIATPVPTPTAVLAVAQVVILDVDLQAEVVTIANTGGALQDMTGWTVVSEVGEQTFRFPDGYVLAPGASVRITSGPSGDSDPPGVLQWLKADGSPYVGYVWKNDGDPAVLTDEEGNVVSTYP